MEFYIFSKPLLGGQATFWGGEQQRDIQENYQGRPQVRVRQHILPGNKIPHLQSFWQLRLSCLSEYLMFLFTRFPAHVSEGARDLITQLLRKDPNQRIPLDKVAWLKKNMIEQIHRKVEIEKCIPCSVWCTPGSWSTTHLQRRPRVMSAGFKLFSSISLENSFWITLFHR